MPFAELADAVSPSTRLVACSHVSWVSGRVVDSAALAETGVPVLLDAAQGVGAVPVDVEALGCAFYAGSGQKWLCGPEGSGCLYVRPRSARRAARPWPGYSSLADAQNALELAARPRTPSASITAFPPDCAAPGRWPRWACSRTRLGVGPRPRGRPRRGAGRRGSPSAGSRSARGGARPWCRGGPRMPTPRSSVWPRAASSCAASRRSGCVRASVGAWSSEEELDRLVGRRRLARPAGGPRASAIRCGSRVDVELCPGGQTRTASGPGRRPASMASELGAPTPTRIGAPATAAFWTSSKDSRPLTHRTRSPSGSRPSSSARPTTLSMALWRPTSSRV